MTQLTHSQYCHNKLMWLNAGGKITPEGEYYVVDGVKLTHAEMCERYPVNGVQLITWKQKKHNKGENPNTKNFS